jgi:hypothetical protein
MAIIFRRFVCSIVLSVGYLSAAPIVAQTPTDSAAYIKIALSAKGTSYCVGGTKCVVGDQGFPYLDLMEKLATALKNGGKGQLIAIIIAPDVGVSTANQLAEVAQKVGFERVRIFVEIEKHTRIREIALGKTFAAPSTAQAFFRLDDSQQ